MAPQLDAYFKQVETLSDHFIDRLSKAVAIPSVSAEDERRPEVVRVSLSRETAQLLHVFVAGNGIREHIRSD